MCPPTYSVAGRDANPPRFDGLARPHLHSFLATPAASWPPARGPWCRSGQPASLVKPGSVRQKPQQPHPARSSCRAQRTRRLVPVRTYSPKPADIQREWHVIDATDVVLGRLAVQTANLLRGKHKPIFAPHVDTGDYGRIVHAQEAALSGTK